jgi:hypothetical protein
MIQISESVSLGLSFDGRDFPLEVAGFRTVTIHNLARLPLPTVELDLIDNLSFFMNAVPLSADLPFTVEIGDGSKKPTRSYKFRVWNFRLQQAEGVTSYRIIGYLDAPKLMHETSARAIRATSSDALAQIANRVGLRFEGQQTNDLQSWIPGNDRNLVFAKEIAAHGYASDRSFMVLVLTMDGRMVYKDLSTLNTGRVDGHFIHEDPQSQTKNGKPVYQVLDRELVSISGFQNARGGYSHKVVTQSVVADAKVVDKLSVKGLTENLMRDTDLAGALSQSRVDVRPIDCGNVHPNYERAAYQNYRASLIFSMGVQLMIGDHTTDFLHHSESAGQHRPWRRQQLLTSTAQHAGADLSEHAPQLIAGRLDGLAEP